MLPYFTLAVAFVVSLYLQFSANVSYNKIPAQQELVGVNTTIDTGLQQIAEKVLKDGLQNTPAERGLVLVMDVSDGSIKAVTSLVNDKTCRINTTCKDGPILGYKDWEPGSVMKPLILAAAINEGKSSPSSIYNDSGSVWIGNRDIKNTTYRTYGTINMQEVINSSVNTGAVHLLKQLGNNRIDAQSRTTWHHYLVNRYKFTEAKQLGLLAEEKGFVRPPKGGRDLDYRYAGSSFGIGLTVTPTRLAAAYAALVNGGVYHEPRLSILDTITSERVLSESTSKQMEMVLKTAAQGSDFQKLPFGVAYGGKTGSAPLTDGDGYYRTDRDSGTFVGFIGGHKERHVVIVRLDAPDVVGFASTAARSAWVDLANKIIAFDKNIQ